MDEGDEAETLLRDLGPTLALRSVGALLLVVGLLLTVLMVLIG